MGDYLSMKHFFAKYSVFHVFLHIRDPKITLMSTKSDVLYNCKPWVAILKMLRTICQEQRFSILHKSLPERKPQVRNPWS